MADERPIIPTRFQLSWLLGPLAILLVAIAFVFLIPDAPPAPTNPGIIEQPALVEKNVDVNAAREQAKLQCSQTYTCTQVDCLEKVLVHVDSASVFIDAILRTPAPKVLRDHLRLAIKRGVKVRMVLDATLSSKFFMQGATIRVKPVQGFVASNFMIVDAQRVVHGTDPSVYAIPPDVIHVACEEKETQPYLTLFDRVWGTESTPFTPDTLQEEAVFDAELAIPSDNSCDESSCGPDTYVCSGTTKVYTDYFCSGSCVYQIIPLYFSPTCGYATPGFDENGNPLIVISETEVDEGQVGNEFIEFLALQSVELTGFTLVKDDNTLITFSNPFILNGAARVYTSTGASTSTVVYLNLPSALWNTSGTTATLLNPDGQVVATRTFE